MLTDDSERIAAPPRVAESAKPKAQPPPVAKKPMGLMERITSEKKTSNGSGEREEQTPCDRSLIPRLSLLPHSKYSYDL